MMIPQAHRRSLHAEIALLGGRGEQEGRTRCGGWWIGGTRGRWTGGGGGVGWGAGAG